MLNEDFVKDLFEVCRKHKKNATVKVEADVPGISHYDVEITGAWDILETESAVDVFAVGDDDHIMSLKGTKKK